MIYGNLNHIMPLPRSFLNPIFEKGIYRKSCEVAMKVLRSNRESLMSVLETFLHDPLCEWSKPLKKNSSKSSVTSSRANDQSNELAKQKLMKIEKKMRGDMSSTITNLSYEAHVHELINQATDFKKLSHMYIGV